MSGIMGGGGAPPQQPPFHQIKIPQLANKALNQDIRRYLSYQFPVFPGLAQLRQNEIQDAYRQLTGPLSPEFQSTFMNTATAGAQSATGGGDPFSGMALQAGSLAQGNRSSQFTRQTLAKQDYDRARMESLMQANPQPGLGLSQQDILGLTVYNTNAQNASAMGNYSNQIAGANAAYQNQLNTWNTIGNTISGLGNIYGQYQMYNGGYGDVASLGQSFGGGV